MPSITPKSFPEYRQLIFRSKLVFPFDGPIAHTIMKFLEDNQIFYLGIATPDSARYGAGGLEEMNGPASGPCPSLLESYYQ